MAFREIRKEGDPILRKLAKPVKEINDYIRNLVEDMEETMYKADGVGLAAPQVGVLRRVILVDIGDEDGLGVYLNPEILEASGQETDVEGCLSIPKYNATVTRPTRIKIRYMNMDGEMVEEVYEEFKARALCHEIDHLNGVLFRDKAIDEVRLNKDGELVKVGN